MKTLKEDFKSLIDYASEIFDSMGCIRDFDESSDGLELSIIVPGFKKEEITVNVEHQNLIITGKPEKTTNITQPFQKIYRLPLSVNPDKITAKQENGLLIISVMKGEKPSGKKINIE